jgi:Holliday junction resolvase-like predicted endonuclease
MSLAEFKKCLEIGHTYEKKSINILKKHNFKYIKCNYKYNPYYDLTAFKKKQKVYIEVKYNSLTDRTKHIFLECFKIDLNPSGLSITKADYYIFFSNSKYWICKTDHVKKVLEQTIRHELKKASIYNATEEQLLNFIEHNGIRTKNTIGILIKVSDVLKISIYNGSLYNSKYNKRLF